MLFYNTAVLYFGFAVIKKIRICQIKGRTSGLAVSNFI